MSDELKIAALLLLLDEANQKPLPQVMQDVACEWLAERDTTPVDAEWLDGVMERDLVAIESCWVVGACRVVSHGESSFAMWLAGLIRRDNPTRGDVLTALRLFGGDNPQ